MATTAKAKPLSVTFKDRSAIVLVVALVAFMVLRRSFERSTLPEDGQRALISWLKAERSRRLLPQLNAELDRRKSDATILPSIQAMGEPIQINEIRAKGAGSNIIVKARVRIGDREPETRYFRMSHGLVGGWLVRGNSSALLYELKVF